jgi:vacuolar-type H+-ATPase subunit C/Vma6
MAEAERLDGLCRIRNLSELFCAICPEAELQGVTQFQRLLVSELADELYEFLPFLSGPGADLLRWMLVRFQVENLKVLARQSFTGSSPDKARAHLVPLPGEFSLNIQDFSQTESLEDFVRLIPKGPFRESAGRMVRVARDKTKMFFFEAALDRAYFEGLVARADRLAPEDNELVRAIVCQEADMFHLMLVVRGKFHYRLSTEMVQPFHVAGTMISRGLFAAMLNDLELDVSVGRVSERVLYGMPFQQGPCDGSKTVESFALEGMAWRRFLRLSNMAFRKSHIGLGTVMGYAGLRRVEVANLITISEGIRGSMSPEAIRAHLIMRNNGEWSHV